MSKVPVLLLSSVLGLSSAHICMWNPLQRNRDGETYNISSPGNTWCRNTDDDVCGGVPAGRVFTHLVGGEPFDVTFQQNLNHFYVGNPGELVADFADVPNPLESDFYELTALPDYNAMNEITQTNFTLRVQVPNTECSHCVMRLRYLPNNSLEPATFYQCADVSVSASTGSGTGVAPSPDTGNLRGGKAPGAAAALLEGGADCCTPRQFSMQAYETSSWRQPTHLSYYFDTDTGMQRIDTNSGSGTTIYDGHFQMYSNYSSGAEAYYNVVDDTCVVYGLDFWNDWCYGSQNNEVYVETVMIGNEAADVWQVPGNVYSWSNTQENCIPVSLNRFDTGETTFYYNFKEGSPSPELFMPPAACVTELSRVAHLHHSALPRAPHGHPSIPRQYKN